MQGRSPLIVGQATPLQWLLKDSMNFVIYSKCWVASTLAGCQNDNDCYLTQETTPSCSSMNSAIFLDKSEIPQVHPLILSLMQNSRHHGATGDLGADKGDTVVC